MAATATRLSGESKKHVLSDNAAKLAMWQLEMYNKPVSASKADGFFACFAESCCVLDLLTSEPKLDAASFRPRYRTVFRESPSLRATVTKRVYIDREGDEPGADTTTAFALDFEAYFGLRAPLGTGIDALDGSEGLSEPRQAHIAVLYEARAGLIRRVWMAEDARMLGPDDAAGEAEVLASDATGAALALAAEILGKGDLRVYYSSTTVPLKKIDTTFP